MFKIKKYTPDELLTGQMGRDWQKQRYNPFEEGSRGSSAAAGGGGLGALAFLILMGWAYFSNHSGASPQPATQQSEPAAAQQEAAKTAGFRIRQVQLRVHGCPSVTCAELFRVNQGGIVTVLADNGNGWYKIQAGSQSGFARLLATK